ncbi:MAG: hypothetical protein Q9219_000570 [cf. Caloplaca sp. 3 TL-2023]
MTEARKYTVRPYKPVKANGDICDLSKDNSQSFPALAWPASEKIQDTIVQTTKPLQTLYSLKLGDQVSLSRSSTSIQDAHEICVSECQDSEQRPLQASLHQSEERNWAWLLEYEVNQAGILCPGMILTQVRAKGEQRSFRIDTIDSNPDIALYQYATVTTVLFSARKDQIPQSLNDEDSRSFQIDASLVGGLDAQLTRLNSAIAKYGTSRGSCKITVNHRPRKGGILLFGPSGTGKSMLLRMIAQASWRRVFYIRDIIDGIRAGNTNQAVQKLFIDAYRLQPSVIIIDDLDSIAGKEDSVKNSQSLNIANSLCQAFDQRSDSQVLVLAATRDLARIDDSLRRPSRFRTEIEIPVPGVDARAQILHIAANMPKDGCNPQLLELANRTHGYVGADLVELVDAAMDKAADRIELEAERNHPLDNANPPLGFAKAVTEKDVEAAFLEAHPTAMKEIFLDTPKVRWSQIGGQNEVKEALQEAIEWPLKYRAEMNELGLLPKKGLLLYGPPGCSKTLAAKAVATETNINFIAVKGAEVLSMYVGESERAVREVFRKARAASPSVVFFDEIDAIGNSRQQSSQGGLHVLTTLLNEMDGIEALNGVFILAATNHPQVLDPALLRPGRLESSIYVGLPDLKTRLEILAIATREMKIGTGVDMINLARTTDGYSGAEIVSICQQAGYAILKERVQSGLRPTLSLKHFEMAIGKVRKQVTPEMIDQYEAWRSARQ